MELTAEQLSKLPKEAQEAFKALQTERNAMASALSGSGKFSLKVGEKGTVVISGFGRYPHSFYVEQLDGFTAWIRGDGVKAIEAFKAANTGKLKTKAAAVVAAVNAPVAPAGA